MMSWEIEKVEEDGRRLRGLRMLSRFRRLKSR